MLRSGSPPGASVPDAPPQASPGAAGGAAADDRRLWLEPLAATGAARDDALVRLHAVLLRAARFEVARRRASVPHLRGGDLDDVAMQAADDAMMGVLRRLADFRGASRFTTWAYKFALLEAAVAVRRRAWQGREIPLADPAWERLTGRDPGPHETAERAEVLRALGAAVAEVLTAHQRDVLVALALNGVPIDVLAERLGTTRGALYKTLHDARRRLRGHLLRQGLSADTGAGDA